LDLTALYGYPKLTQADYALEWAAKHVRTTA
jgi:hypothetical protein